MDAALANGLAHVINLFLNMIQLLVIASIAVSWLGGDPNNPIVRMIHTATEPVFRIVRPLTRKIPGPLDWAPLVVLLVVVFLQKTVVAYLSQYAMRAGFN